MRYLIATMTMALVLAASTNAALAAKEKFVRSKPHVNIGAIGHVDQGNNVVTLFVRPAASVIDRRQSCAFEGDVIVSVLGGEQPDRSSGPVAIRELVEHERIHVVLKDQKEVAEIALNLPQDPTSPRQTYHVNIVPSHPKLSDPCGLEVSIDEKDTQTQEGGRHTPMFIGYRPQFYIR